MRYLVVLCVLGYFAESKSPLSKTVSQFTCSRRHPQFSKCLVDSFEKNRGYLLQGVPELGVPPMDPFQMPLLIVNRTVNNLVKIDAVCRNMVITGGSGVKIEYFKADPLTHQGEIRGTVPFLNVDMDYDVKGQLLSVPLQSKGHFQGNFTNTQAYIKMSLKFHEQDGEQYYRVNKLISKMNIADGHIKLVSEDKNSQYAADIITEFFNENPRTVMDILSPIIIDTSSEIFRIIWDHILSHLPADEWLLE